jgi:hypothetical protein
MFPAKLKRNRELVLKRKSGWSFRKLAEYFNLSPGRVFEIWSGNEEKYQNPKVDNSMVSAEKGR